MFDIGFSEMLLLAVIALVAIGPKQLPEVARVLGRFLRDIKKSTGELTETFVKARDQVETSFLDARNAADQAAQDANAAIQKSFDSQSINTPNTNSGINLEKLPETQPETQPETKPETKPETLPLTQPNSKPESSPQAEILAARSAAEGAALEAHSTIDSIGLRHSAISSTKSADRAIAREVSQSPTSVSTKKDER
jgi:sec-independent protein translocase protein TatB